MNIIIKTIGNVGKIGNLKLLHATPDGGTKYYICNTSDEIFTIRDINPAKDKDVYGHGDLWYLTWEKMFESAKGIEHKYYEIYYDIPTIKKTIDATKQTGNSPMGWEMLLRLVAFYNISHTEDTTWNSLDTEYILDAMKGCVEFDPRKYLPFENYSDFETYQNKMIKTLKVVETCESNQKEPKEFIVYNLDRALTNKEEYQFVIQISEKFVTMGYINGNEWYYCSKYPYRECAQAQHISSLEPVFRLREQD